MMQEASCYSTSKRTILAEKETSRIPVKITHYTKTADPTKLVVNNNPNHTPEQLRVPISIITRTQPAETNNLR